MNCGDIEENPGVLDQCQSNNSFVTNAVLGVLLETRLREFNRIAVDVGGGGDFIFVLCHINCMEILTTIFMWVVIHSVTEINTKLLQRTYFAPLLSHANLSFLPTSLNSPPGANCQIRLLLTERYQSQKIRRRLMALKMYEPPRIQRQ